MKETWQGYVSTGRSFIQEVSYHSRFWRLRKVLAAEGGWEFVSRPKNRSGSIEQTVRFLKEFCDRKRTRSSLMIGRLRSNGFLWCVGLWMALAVAANGQ